jgi:hypothetical protein
MPATNMAGPLVVIANPLLGKFVMMSAFSGPKGSPFDAKRFNPTTFAKENDPTNYSTGALNTGIGIGANRVINVSIGTSPATAPQAIKDRGYTDDIIPGLNYFTQAGGAAMQTAPDARLTLIGGGRSNILPAPGNTGLGVSTPVPWSAVPLVGWGAGGTRDAGAGPAFTGFPVKMVTAAGAVAIGAAIETGWVNRSDFAMVATESAFGSGTAASTAPTIVEFEEEEP